MPRFSNVAQAHVSAQFATPRTAFRPKPRHREPPNRDERSSASSYLAAGTTSLPPPLRSKPRCCEFSTPRQAQSKRLDAPIRWQQCPFWPKWDELPAMFDMLASPTFTNRSHFGRLFPPNLALRRFGIPRLSRIAFFSPSRRTGLSHFACFPPSRAAPLSHFARFKPTSKTTSSTAAAKQRNCTS